jgi:hypothetical protein
MQETNQRGGGMTNPVKRILTSKDEIMDFLGVKRTVFDQLLKIHLPVVVINGRYYAHSENLDTWMKVFTSKQRPEIIIPETPESQ